MCLKVNVESTDTSFLATLKLTEEQNHIFRLLSKVSNQSLDEYVTECLLSCMRADVAAGALTRTECFCD